jgi:hypothetical protein
MHENHNPTKRNVAVIILRLYNTLTKALVLTLVRSCGTIELRKAANLRKTIVLSDLSLLKEYFTNRNE